MKLKNCWKNLETENIEIRKLLQESKSAIIDNEVIKH